MATILVIDDSASMLEWMRGALAGGGHEPVLCTTGDQALLVVAERTVDLIVTDIYMPGEDGLAVIMQLKKSRPGIPVIAISGMSGRWNMLEVAEQLGAFRTLQKPFAPAVLLEAVDAALAA